MKKPSLGGSNGAKCFSSLLFFVAAQRRAIDPCASRHFSSRVLGWLRVRTCTSICTLRSLYSVHYRSINHRIGHWHSPSCGAVVFCVSTTRRTCPRGSAGASLGCGQTRTRNVSSRMERGGGKGRGLDVGRHSTSTATRRDVAKGAFIRSARMRVRVL